MAKRKASHYYCVNGCLNSDIDTKLTLFSLPRDTERRKKWLAAINREDISTKGNGRVCSLHFEDSMIKLTRFLKSDAVPTRLLSNESQAITSNSDTQTASDVTTIEEASTASVEPQSESMGTSGTETETPKLTTDPQKEQTMRNLEIALKRSYMKCVRLENEALKMKKELEGKNKSLTCDDPDDEVNRRFRKLIEWQNKLKDKYNGNQYDTEYRNYALNFYYSSPHAYQCLRILLNLPSKSALSRFKMNIPPKLDYQVLDGLKIKLKSLPHIARHCTLCVDEMALKRNLYYDTKTDEVIGFHNVNGRATPEMASNAYVMMLQGIYLNWEQPIAYALFANTNYYEDLDLWLNEVISTLSLIGIKVKAVISDQGSNFDKFAKEVKMVTVDKPYFMYDDSKVYYIFDVPHLMKCIRNDLLTNDFYYGRKKISWHFIERLYDDQKDKKLRLIPEITDSHIDPDNFKKVRVKYAIQILSRTVSAALHTYVDLEQFPEEARPTANFIETMNNLFDVLNSSSDKCNNKFKSAFRMTKDQEIVLDDAQKLFASIEAIDRKSGKNNTARIKSFVNFQISIQSIKMLFEDLKNEAFTYLLTRRLNRDSLEKIFVSIRKQSDSCSEPTPIQFRRAFTKLFLRNMITSPPNPKCEVDNTGDVLLKAEDTMNFPITPTPPISAVFLNGETDYRMDLPEENVVIYVAAYLQYKCLKKHKCIKSDKVLNSVPRLGDTKFKFETYNQTLGFYGRLKLPPNEFIQYVQKLETAYIQNFEKLIETNPGSRLYELLKTVPPQIPCECFPTEHLIKLFVRLRIYSTLKFNIRYIKDCKKGAKTYLIVLHL